MRLEVTKPLAVGPHAPDQGGGQAAEPLVEGEPEIDEAPPRVADPLGERLQPLPPELQEPLDGMGGPGAQGPDLLDEVAANPALTQLTEPAELEFDENGDLFPASAPLD